MKPDRTKQGNNFSFTMDHHKQDGSISDPVLPEWLTNRLGNLATIQKPTRAVQTPANWNPFHCRLGPLTATRGVTLLPASCCKRVHTGE